MAIMTRASARSPSRRTTLARRLAKQVNASGRHWVVCHEHRHERDEGGPFGFGNQVPISSHRKLLSSKAMVVNVAETPGQESGRHGRERRAQANRCRSVESGLGDVRTGG